jgi:hypothetical protein
MRAFLLRILLPLFLVLGQAGGAAHELSHLGASGAPSSPDGLLLSDHSCGLCTAFAQLAAGAAPALPAFERPLVAAVPIAVPATLPAPAARIHAFQSRAPPLFS